MVINTPEPTNKKTEETKEEKEEEKEDVEEEVKVGEVLKIIHTLFYNDVVDLLTKPLNNRSGRREGRGDKAC